MTFIWVALLLVFNSAISWANAYYAGAVWQETKAFGGWIRAVAWAAAVQSAMGFTSVIAILLISLLSVTHIMSHHAVSAALSLTYLTIIIPLLGSGFIITIHSWIEAYKSGKFWDVGLATYNTLAMASNTYQAASGISEAFSNVFSAVLKDDDGDAPIILIVVAVALGAGIGLTYYIMQSAMHTIPVPRPPNAPHPA